MDTAGSVLDSIGPFGHITPNILSHPDGLFLSNITMTLSTVGSVRFKVYGVLLLVNTIVVALSAHINYFEGFFYKADVFPFVLSVITLAFVLTVLFTDIKSQNAVTARPPFELSWLLVFGMLWLAFNAFSSSRWKYASLGTCKSIPSDSQYDSYRTWCHELQALRVFVWIEWIMLLFTFVYLLRWTITKHNSGRHDVWSTAFSRFSESPPAQSRNRGETNSEFLQWEKFPQPPEFLSAHYPPSLQSQYGEPLQSQGENHHHLKTQYGQSPSIQYTQSLQGQHPTDAGAPYTQHYPQGQYIPPSQAQFTHSPQAYFNAPEHAQAF